MSKYLTFDSVVFKDKKLLLEALAEIGYDSSKLEIGTDLHLYGYAGDKRAQTADIVIRRKDIGHSSNDVGFTRQPDGSYVPVVSEFDSTNGFQGNSKIPKLRAAYGERVAREVARRMHGSVTKKQEGGTTKLYVRY